LYLVIDFIYIRHYIYVNRCINICWFSFPKCTLLTVVPKHSPAFTSLFHQKQSFIFCKLLTLSIDFWIVSVNLLYYTFPLLNTILTLVQWSFLENIICVLLFMHRTVQVMVFWNVMLCILVCKCQCFRWTYCLHLLPWSYSEYPLLSEPQISHSLILFMCFNSLLFSRS
jgi:hypothetical protein